jgi:Tfp pilus assembly protein PilF
MAKRYSYCSEAYFGLGKIYFSRDHLAKAQEMFEYALKGPKRDPVYCLWAAMTQLYLYRKTTKLDKKFHLAKKIEK